MTRQQLSVQLCELFRELFREIDNTRKAAGLEMPPSEPEGLEGRVRGLVTGIITAA